MAYAKFYTYEEGNTDTLLPITSTNIDLDEITLPTTEMSSVSYFSVEGRTLTISFFNSDDGLQEYLIDNKNNYINSKYGEVLNVFVEIYEDNTTNKIFSGVLNSAYAYDDYDEFFSNVVVMEGLHCFIKYHLESLDTSSEEPYYINTFPDDEDSDSFGEKIDIETLNLGSRDSEKPLNRYFYIFLSGLNYTNTISKQNIINLLNIPLFDKYFPMRISNPDFEGLLDIVETLTNSISPFRLSDISFDSVAKQYFSHKGESYPITSTSDAYLNDNKVFKNNWDNSLVDYYLPNGEVNPKYYFMRKEMWISLNTYTTGVGMPKTSTDGSMDDIYIVDKWYIYNVREIVPYSFNDLNTRDKAYLNQKIIIKKLRFIRHDATNSLYYLGSYDYTNGISELLYYNYVGGGTMDEADKEIISSRLVNGEDLGYNSSVISSNGIPRMCTWRWYVTNYIDIEGIVIDWQYICNSSFGNGTFYNSSYTGLFQTLNGTDFELSIDTDGENNTVTIYGDVCLDERALILSGFSGNIKEYLRTVLMIYNITMIPNSDGDITFIEKLRTTADPSSNTFYLDDSTTRSSIVNSSLVNTDPNEYDLFFYPEPMKGLKREQYRLLFGNFTSERQFISLRYAFYTEPQINDIIMFRNKQYWINSIKLSNDYQTYTIKVYEVKNVLS